MCRGILSCHAQFFSCASLVQVQWNRWIFGLIPKVQCCSHWSIDGLLLCSYDAWNIENHLITLIVANEKLFICSFYVLTCPHMTHCHVLRFFSFFCDSVPLVSEPQVASDILFNNFSLRCPIRCHDFVFHCCHGFVKDSEALAAFWWSRHHLHWTPRCNPSC